MKTQEIMPGARSAGEQFDRLFAVVQRLRAPDGCPWDREQTPLSLRGGLAEEAWECVEALGEQDPDHIREELGDVFLLVTMLSWMHEESSAFSLAQVLDGICEKLIRRHPHVFGESAAATSAEVLVQWDRIKQDVEGRAAKDSVLDSVKKSLPPLERAFKLQKKAAKTGFDWKHPEGLWDKMAEEERETREAWEALQACSDREGEEGLARKHHLEEELGDMLFMAVNICRFMEVDPALALQRCNSKFESRFRHVEKRTKEAPNSSIDDMESFWNEAKSLESPTNNT